MAKREIQYEFRCSDRGHPQDLSRVVAMSGNLDFILGAARAHFRRSPDAVIVLTRSMNGVHVVIADANSKIIVDERPLKRRVLANDQRGRHARQA